MPVHLYGQAVPMERSWTFARRHGILRRRGCVSGARRALERPRASEASATSAAFSFYPGKNLGAYGDGGAVVTNDAGARRRLRLMRDFGQRKKYEHLIKAGNCRLDSIQAAVLDVKLRISTSGTKRAGVTRPPTMRGFREIGITPPRVCTTKGTCIIST